MQRLVPLVLQNYGSARRSGDLFSNKSWLAVTKKAMQKSIKGVANVYTQHTPYLAATLEAISKGLLSEGAFPEVGGGGAGAGGAAGGAATKRRAPTEIIVFVVGGITYEEALCRRDEFGEPGCPHHPRRHDCSQLRLFHR